MNETFDIPLTYNGKEIIFPARLLILGYTHKIQVEINGKELFFEPDEERNYRAVLAYDSPDEAGNTDRNLLKAIADAIEEIIR